MALRQFTILAAALAVSAPAAHSQTAPAYDPLKTFAPLTLPAPPTTLRTGAGTPGPAYWQNRADYNLEARIDTAAHVLHGEETVTYTNNSPDTLDFLWFQLDQNLYRRDSRGYAMSGGRRIDPKQSTEGYVIEAVTLERGGKGATLNFVVADTRMRVDLPAAVKGAGGQVKLHIRYHYTVPGLFGGRTAWNTNKSGDIYDIAQWYPRLQVYDDVRGWDTLPYLANEFYLEYGAFDYAVTVPADMIVAGSGALTNPQEVLSAEQRARWERAKASDKTVLIRTPEEVAATPPASGTKTWRFHMENTRDVAFTASRAFVWDAARINLPDGKTAVAQSVYPPESVGENAWSRSTEYMKDAVERFSKRWYPYPWPNAINVAGPATGMEYPGIVFDGIPDKAKTLFFISAHEIGHSWFPMIVGSDERRDAWMDEGINTFIDVYESDDFSNGVYGPKRDGEYAPDAAGTPADQIAILLKDPEAPVIMSRGDTIREKYRHPVTYFKAAFALTLLREDILGPQRFDPAFRKYISDWAYKHPKPSDFFREMESAGGEDLSWFWRGYFLNNWTHDMAVTGVTYVDGDPGKGAQVSVANLGQLVLPATLRITYKNGDKRDLRIPVETWMQSGTHVFGLEGAGPIAEATVDPDHRLPDADRSNNSFKPN
jgi:peptidase M1-like protein